MNKNKILALSTFITLWLLSSCASNRNLVYFSDLNNNYKTTISNSATIRFQPNDLLSIKVNSLSPESNALFNTGRLQQNNITASVSTEIAQDNGYLIGDDGTIDFPIVGKVKLGQLSKEEATAKLTQEIQKFVKSPVVTIRLVNFKVTVIGEVNRPSTFIVPAERINILEALGLAGDMTAYGKRENVLLIREINGIRTTTRIDLNNKVALDSPYFYLQQNDVVYVEPDRIKEVQASTNTRSLTIATLALSVVVALIFNFRNIF